MAAIAPELIILLLECLYIWNQMTKGLEKQWAELCVKCFLTIWQRTNSITAKKWWPPYVTCHYVLKMVNSDVFAIGRKG